MAKSKYNEKIHVGVLGATGAVGQMMCLLLSNHPWFKVVVLAASKNSAGKLFGDLMTNRWLPKQELPKQYQNIKLKSVEDDIDEICSKVDIVFCSIDAASNHIRKIEEKYAEKIAVLSTNSAHRWTDYVPMIVPEINHHHFAMINYQRKKFNWQGFIVAKPNCSIQSYLPLIKIWQDFEPTELIVSTYQAISGAGKNFTTWPDMVDNVIPYIHGEEAKSELEPLKILAKINSNKFINAELPRISANCIRVPVSDGHMAAINIKFGKKVKIDELIDKLNSFVNPMDEYSLPSSPKQFIEYFSEDTRPQTKMDRDNGNGMSISVGRIREDNIFDF